MDGQHREALRGEIIVMRMSGVNQWIHIIQLIFFMLGKLRFFISLRPGPSRQLGLFLVSFHELYET